MGIRLLLADDHVMVREGMHALLEKEPDMIVVAEADNGREALRLARELHPDVVLMDIAMPEMNGIEATRRIMEEVPQTRVIAITMQTDPRTMLAVLEAGAKGYLSKDFSSDDLFRTIRAVNSGKESLHPRITEVIGENYRERSGDMALPSLSILTQRELEVFQFIAEGKNTKEIAYSLDLSTKTVETHRTQIKKKLKTFSIVELTKLAIREGVVTL